MTQPKSSIHIVPVKGNSEAHNLRNCEKLDYVRYDLSGSNQSAQLEPKSIKEHHEYLKTFVKEQTGRSMQAKATPIREGVVNLSDHVTMSDLQDLSKKLEDQFGIRTMQIHIHEDEGHYQDKKNNKDWKSNRHAHMLFSWVHEENFFAKEKDRKTKKFKTVNRKGKAVRLNKAQMASMQTTVAEILKMERGVSSDRKHLPALEYKQEQQRKEIHHQQKELDQLLGEYQKVQDAKSEAKEAVFSKIGAVFGKGKLVELEEENRILELTNTVLTDDLKVNVQKYRGEKKQLLEELHSKDQTIINQSIMVSKLEASNKTLSTEVRNLEIKNHSLQKTINRLKVKVDELLHTIKISDFIPKTIFNTRVSLQDHLKIAKEIFKQSITDYSRIPELLISGKITPESEDLREAIQAHSEITENNLKNEHDLDLRGDESTIRDEKTPLKASNKPIFKQSFDIGM